MAGKRGAAFHNSPPSLEVTRAGSQASAKAEFARRLNERMVIIGWNQATLARRAQEYAAGTVTVTRDKISKYIRGESFPNPATLQAICQALGCQPADLMPTRGIPEVADNLPPAEVREVSEGVAWLKVNQAVSWEAALKILAILKGTS